MGAKKCPSQRVYKIQISPDFAPSHEREVAIEKRMSISLARRVGDKNSDCVFKTSHA